MTRNGTSLFWKGRDTFGTTLRRNSFYSVLGFVVPALVLLAFTPVLIHSMGTANYGLWAISLAGFGLLGVAELGLGVAIAKYVAEYRQANDTVGLSSTASAGLALYVLIAVLLTVPFYLAAGTIAQLFSSSEVSHAQVEHVVQLVSLGLLPLLLMSWGLAIAVGLQRFQIPMLAAVAQNGLTVVIAVVVVSLGGSVDDVVLSSLCVLCAVALASAAIGVRMLAPLGARPMLSVRFVRGLLPYVFFTSVSSLGSILFASVDRIAVGAVIDLRAAAYYAVSIGIATKLLSLSDVLTRPLMPASSSLQRAGEIDLVRRQLRVATTGVTALSTALRSGPLRLRGAATPDLARERLRRALALDISGTGRRLRAGRDRRAQLSRRKRHRLPVDLRRGRDRRRGGDDRAHRHPRPALGCRRGGLGERGLSGHARDPRLCLRGARLTVCVRSLPEVPGSLRGERPGKR